MRKLKDFLSDPEGQFALIIFGLSVMLGGGLLLIGGCSPDRVEEPRTPSTIVAEIKQASKQVGSVQIQVVVIDGVEYLIAETYRGVSICQKARLPSISASNCSSWRGRGRALRASKRPSSSSSALTTRICAVGSPDSAASALLSISR